MAINSYPEIQVDKLPTPGDDMPGVKDIVASGYITDKYTHSGTIAAGVYKMAVNTEDYIGIGATFIFGDNEITLDLDGILNKETSVRLTTAESNFKVLAGFQNADLALNLSTNGRKVVYGNGVYISLGAGANANSILRRSTNLTAWAQIQNNALASVSSRTIEGLNYVNDRWYIFGRDSSLAQSTDDGITWTSVSSVAGANTSATFYSAAFTTGNYVVAADNTGSISASHSTDGITWTTKSLGGAMWDVIFAEGTFVIVGNDGRISTSTNGVTWTSRTSGTTGQLIQVIHDGSKFYAADMTNLKVIQSTDSVTWSNLPIPFQLRGDRYVMSANTSGDEYYFVDIDQVLWRTTNPSSASSWIKTNGSQVQVSNSGTAVPTVFSIAGISYANEKFIISQSGLSGAGWSYPNRFRGVAFKPTVTPVEFYVYSTDLENKDN